MFHVENKKKHVQRATGPRNSNGRRFGDADNWAGWPAATSQLAYAARTELGGSTG